MAQATVSIRMDAELKNQMEKLCDELGMNLTTAFTIFAKKAIRERRIPFEVSASAATPAEKEIVMIQKATVYDLKRILREQPDKTYTQEELEKILDAYITGAEQ